ncbi:Folate-biopterin transporter 1, chloroplastic, partial [Mucuna pruriens]
MDGDIVHVLHGETIIILDLHVRTMTINGLVGQRRNGEFVPHGNVAVAMIYFVQGVLELARLVVNFYLKDDLYLDLVETIVISGFSTLCDLSNLCMCLLVILSPSLVSKKKFTSSILSRLIGALSWSLMTTFIDYFY